MNAPSSVTLWDLIDANGIDVSANPILDGIGLAAWQRPLPVREAPKELLERLVAMQGHGKTVWSMRTRASASSRDMIEVWRQMLRDGSAKHPADIIVVDGDAGDDPVVVDGHHRVVAALHEGASLRYVDLADLSA